MISPRRSSIDKTTPTKLSESKHSKVGRARDENKHAFHIWLDSALSVSFKPQSTQEILVRVLEFCEIKSLTVDMNVRGLVKLLGAAALLADSRVTAKAPGIWIISGHATLPLPKGKIAVGERTYQRLKKRVADSIVKEVAVEAVTEDVVVHEAAPARARVQAYSLQYKLAYVEFYLISGVSERKACHAMALIVFESLKELFRQKLISVEVPLTSVMKVVPARIGPMLKEAAEVNDYNLGRMTQRLDGIFSINDAGNAGDEKYTYKLGAGYDHQDDCIWEMLLGADVLDGGGAGIAASVIADATRLKIKVPFIGSATDNASDVIKTFVRCMQEKYPNFVGVGCVLHILNLILMNAYHSTFGKEEMGKPSALRASFMVNYLMGKYSADWKKFCTATSRPEISFMMAGASKGRWWSVIKGFGDVYHNRSPLSDWCLKEAQDSKSATYGPLFEETAAWLVNAKVVANLAFVLAFNVVWWEPQMTFAQGIGPWQSDLPLAKQRAGYRADEYSVRTVVMRRDLQALDFAAGVQFSRWRGHLASLSEEERDFAMIEAQHFRAVALETAGNHHFRWLRELVDCAIYHPNRVLGVAVATHLLAIYDEIATPVIGPDLTVLVDGEDINLAWLLAELTQFITTEDLQQKTVLFPNPQNVADLRKWVEARGEFPDVIWSRRLRRNMNTFIRACPVHSHTAERTVNLGNRLKRRGAHGEGRERTAAKVGAVANGTSLDWREAVCAEEELLAAALRRYHIVPNQRVQWRDHQTGTQRSSRSRTDVRNKRVTSQALLRFRDRAEAAVAVEAAAKAQAKESVIEGTDRESVSRKARAGVLAEKASRGDKRRASSGRAKKINTDTRKELASKCDPARLNIGKLDLKHPPVKAVLAVECNLRGNAAASEDDTVASLVAWLSSYEIALGGDQFLIPQLSTFEGQAKIKWRTS